MNDNITLLIVDGDLLELDDPCSTSVIRYIDLTHDEALSLAEQSIKQGYAVVAWMDLEGDAKCGEEA